MIRTIALAVALTFIGTAANAGGHYTHKLCHGKTLRGKTVDFRCNIDEKCCFNKIRSKGFCAKNTGRILSGRCIWFASRETRTLPAARCDARASRLPSSLRRAAAPL